MKELLLLLRMDIQNTIHAKFKHHIYLGLAALAIMIFMGYYTKLLLVAIPAGLSYSVPYIMGFTSLFLIFIMTLSLAFGYIIGFKDRDMLLSLPLKKFNIYFSKLLGLIFINLAYYLCFMFPVMICYGLDSNQSLSFYLFSLIGMFFQPLMIIAIAIMLSLLIAKYSGNGRYRQLITNILTVITVTLTVILSLNLSNQQQDFFLLYQKISNIIPTLKWYISACINGNLMLLLLSVGINVLVLLIVVYGSKDLMIRLNQNYAETYHNADFKVKGIKKSSVFMTILIKELKGFFFNFNYFLNLGFSSILSIVLILFFIIRYSSQIQTVLNTLPYTTVNNLFVFICLLIAFINMIDCSSCVSISLEGKNLWILKSLPIKVMDIFKAKIIVNVIIVTVTSWVNILIIIFFIPATMLHMILAGLLMLLIGVFVGCYGLVINLLFPKLEWDREIVVIKQSLASFFAVISLMIIAGLICFLGYNLTMNLNATYTFLILSFIFLSADILLYLCLKIWGTKKFLALN
ncbi:MAG: hypothetical protein MR210_03065 [Erysipelotrichaceae bacterium]|nr:hypothetical protein [Erysipelotrichaceae bacterium]MDY5252017.1 hypothetical protein [Erysipelotrichaceae bacterium]